MKINATNVMFGMSMVFTVLAIIMLWLVVSESSILALILFILSIGCAFLLLSISTKNERVDIWYVVLCSNETNTDVRAEIVHMDDYRNIAEQFDFVCIDYAGNRKQCEQHYAEVAAKLGKC